MSIRGEKMYIPLAAIILLGATNTFLIKKFQIAFTFSPQNFLWYNLINAMVATVAFYIICGFKIEINLITACFALVYACIVFGSLCFSVLALSVLTIPVSSVLSSSGALLLGSFAGFFIFGEKPNIFIIFSIIIAFCACLLPFVNYKKGDSSFRTVVISLVYFTISGASSIIMKLYVTNPNTKEPNQLFFLTNIFLIIFSFSGILILKYFKKLKFKDIITSLKAVQIINISARTIISNISSLVSATVIATIPLATYNIVMPTLTMVATLCVSEFLFKEQLKKQQIIALILMLTASVLCNI